MSKTHEPVHCICCRSAIWFPLKSTATEVSSKLKAMGWAVDVKDDGVTWETFCSAECKSKGAPKRIRRAVTMHVDFDKSASIAFRQGSADAIGGYDTLSGDPSYLRGYNLGMSLRAAAERAVTQFQEMNNE